MPKSDPKITTKISQNSWKWIAVLVIGLLAAVIVVQIIIMSTMRGGGSNVADTGVATPPSYSPTDTNQQSCNGSSCSSTADGVSADAAPIIGEVTAISDSSITVDVAGRKYTFSITGDTKEFNGGGSMTPTPFDKAHSPIGEMVGVVPTIEGSTEAKLILSDFQTR